jgi:NAD(P)-dependent dehydrogenase (short-subunit alcohol dehydrogenase family)
VISNLWQIHSKTVGNIDILVNNAGISHIGKADTTSESDFERVFKVNVKGMYNCCMKRSL